LFVIAVVALHVLC